MEDPTRELPPLRLGRPDYDPLAEIREIRAWRAEQRAKYGPRWEGDYSDDESRSSLTPADQK